MALAWGAACAGSLPLYLRIFQLHRSFTVKYLDHDPDLLLLGKHISDFAVETGKRSIVDLDNLANHEIVCRILGALIDVVSRTEHAHDLALAKRLRLSVLAASFEEINHIRSVYELVLNLTYKNALYKYIAGIKVFLFDNLFSVFNG